MFLKFFYELKQANLPVTVKEYMSLMDILTPENRLVDSVLTLDDFYHYARMSMIKDERYFDRFDKIFSKYFKKIDVLSDGKMAVPDDWLLAQLRRKLSPEEMAKIHGMDWSALQERLKELLETQKERHEGGNKWIGTGGTSPFGHSGYNPQGHRIGNLKSSGNRTAVKVWEQRQFRDYDDSVELGTRNLKMALRKLRRFAREGSPSELDLEQTIRKTAQNAGYLDLQMMPERRNHVKVLMLMDVGGSMDDHITRTEQLFSAAKSEFKHLEFFYFHNCVYDFVWRNSYRRLQEKIDVYELIRTYPSDYKLIFVGDATMSPYEILYANGSVEYNNAEAGSVWLQRLLAHFKSFVWLNPQEQGSWEYIESINIINQLLGQNRMYPLTLKGLESAIRILRNQA